MKHVTGLIGRDELIERVTREARKGRHLLLTGRPGIGKSTVLEAVLDRLIEAIGPSEMHAQDTGEDEEPREWSPI